MPFFLLTTTNVRGELVLGADDEAELVERRADRLEHGLPQPGLARGGGGGACTGTLWSVRE